MDGLNDDEVSDFGLAFHERICDLNRWRVWGAGYLIAGGMSDDGFRYFRAWIIGKGKDVFEVAMREPDELGPFVDNPEVENELLEYVPVNILERRGVQEDPRDRSGRQVDGEPTGDPFDEETIADSYPKLAALFS
ncbi:MAG: DUF4240 domain-containing protein [Paludibaculum sp.]